MQKLTKLLLALGSAVLVSMSGPFLGTNKAQADESDGSTLGQLTPPLQAIEIAQGASTTSLEDQLLAANPGATSLADISDLAAQVNALLKTLTGARSFAQIQALVGALSDSGLSDSVGQAVEAAVENAVDTLVEENVVNDAQADVIASNADSGFGGNDGGVDQTAFTS